MTIVVWVLIVIIIIAEVVVVVVEVVRQKYKVRIIKKLTNL